MLQLICSNWSDINNKKKEALMKKRILSFVIVAMLIITSSFAGSNILSASENGNSVRLSNKKITIVAVSYTHLDVYKRQLRKRLAGCKCYEKE